ncbi:MAG: hypothetical protein ACYC56_02270 [Candidatus Aquicultor sp.]
MRIKLLAIVIAGVLVLGAGYTALSFASTAQPSSIPSTPDRQQVTSQQVTPQADASKEVKDAGEASGAETVDAQEKGGTEKEVTEASGAAEKESAGEAKNEAQEDKGLAGGGHQDKEGADVDHQFEGSE